MLLPDTFRAVELGHWLINKREAQWLFDAVAAVEWRTILDANDAVARAFFDWLMHHELRIFNEERSIEANAESEARPARDVADPAMGRHRDERAK
jgi:hypothetical protein